MLCLKIYTNPISIAILQILTFSTIWTTICKYTRTDNNENKKEFIIQVIITLIISLIPINAIYSITLWKDIIFSYLLMFLCFLIYVLLNKTNQVSYEFIIIISLTMAFVSQLRHNGLLVVLPLLIILAIYLFKTKKSQKLHLYIPALTIIFILLIASLNVVYDVEDNKKDAVFSKTIHLLADYDLNLELESADKDKIHKVIPEKTIKERYDHII